MILSTALVASMLLAPSTFTNSYFEDFEDGVADGWVNVLGDWDVIFGVYQGIGNSWPNNGVHNISYVPQTQSAGMSVEALMSTDTGNDDVNKMLVLRYNDPDNFYIVNFRAGWRRDVVVERVLSGVRTLITPEFQYLIPEHGQADWKRVRADVIGNRVIAYFEGVAVCDIPLPTIVIPSGMAGINVFSSPGGNEEVYVEDFSWAVAQFAPGISLTKIIGGASSGGLTQVSKEDNSYYQVTPAYDIARGTPNVQVVWAGAVDILPIGELTLRFEGGVTSGICQQKVEVWNWQTSAYVLFDTRNVTTTDQPLRFPLDQAQFMSSGGEVRVRASYFGHENSSRFDVRIDEINAHAVAQKGG
jgi:hypothetical protein